MYPLNSAKMSLSEPVISYNIARQRREKKGQCHGPLCGIRSNLFKNILSYWATGVSVVCDRLVLSIDIAKQIVLHDRALGRDGGRSLGSGQT